MAAARPSSGRDVVAGDTIVFRLSKPARDETDKIMTRPAGVPFHTRRSHNKSRAGCVNCKKRKVKCDEEKPNCRRCLTQGASCEYPSSDMQLRRVRKIEPAGSAASVCDGPNAEMYSMFFRSFADTIDKVLGLENDAVGKRLKISGTSREIALSTIQYFIYSASEDQTLDGVVDVMKGDMLRLALSLKQPYLMHSIIATSSTSIVHKQGSVSDETYKMAQAYHWHKTVELYQREVQNNNFGLHNMDALISSCMFINIVSFYLEAFNPLSSWLFSSDPKAMNWLWMQSGMGYLLVRTGRFLGQSIWKEAFMQSDAKMPELDNHSPGREGMHVALANLCGIDEKTTEESNLYHWPLRMLSPLLQQEVQQENLVKYANFMGRLTPDFLRLLYMKDAKALIILAYWMTIMIEIPQWWNETRIKSECTAICMFLEYDESIRSTGLLDIPASACGYVLNDWQGSMLPLDLGVINETSVFDTEFQDRSLLQFEDFL